MDIEETFTYHAPTGTQPERYEQLRGKAKELALLISKNCPESREKSFALTNLQQAIEAFAHMIAINENKVPERTERNGR